MARHRSLLFLLSLLSAVSIVLQTSDACQASKTPRPKPTKKPKSPPQTLPQSICAGATPPPETTTQASSDGCIVVTISNFLNTSDCLGDALDTCPSNTVGVIPGAIRLVSCIVNALTKVQNVGDVTRSLGFLLEDAYIAIVRLAGVPPELDDQLRNIFRGICDGPLASLCKGVPRLRNETCQKPIPIRLRETLNLGVCLKQDLIICKEGQEVQQSDIANLLQVLGCVLSFLSQMPPVKIPLSVVCETGRLVGHLVGIISARAVIVSTKGTPVDPIASPVTTLLAPIISTVHDVNQRVAIIYTQTCKSIGGIPPGARI